MKSERERGRVLTRRNAETRREKTKAMFHALYSFSAMGVSAATRCLLMSHTPATLRKAKT